MNLKNFNLDTLKSRPVILWSLVAVLILAGICALIYGFSGGEKKNAVNDIDAVYTNAAATVNAGQTMIAQSVTPTVTLMNLASPGPSPTFAPLATVTIPPFALTTPTIAAPTSGCDMAVYISDVTVPDRTSMTAGQTFTKTWKVKNTGSCTWTATYKLVFVSGDGMGGASTPIGKEVKPGETADVSVNLTAPAKTGEITGRWRLQNDKSVAFGDTLTVVIKIGTVPTPTKTPGGYPN